MAREQFIGQGITVANAVGERFFDAASKVSDFAREDTTRSVAAAVAFVVVFGAVAASTAITGRENGQDEPTNKRPQS